MLAHEFLTCSAARLPQKVALVCDGRRLTYAELDETTDRLANALVSGGVRRGDRVVVHLRNRVEAAVGIFATLKAGGTFVVIDASTRPGKLKDILNHCRAAALIVDSRTPDGELPDLLAEVSSLAFAVLCGPAGPQEDARVRRFDEIQAESPATPLPKRNVDSDLACLVYTSGSTGEPKAVMCEHGGVDFVTTSITTYLENQEDDVVAGVLPLSSSYGLYQLLMTVKFGGTLVLERSFTYPALILQRIQEERITGLPGVPTVFATLLRMDRSAFDLSSLRYITNAADALAPSLVRALQDAFPGVRIYSMYGLTETSRALYLPPSQLTSRPDSVGIPIPGTQAWLEDGAGRRLGPGSTGELVVSGRHVMRGYWESPEATTRSFRAGAMPGQRVCRTGDLFRTDDEGYFYFVSRKDDVIKSRGEKVAPKEVEAVLHMLPGVTAVVVGVPDPIAGQAIKAFIVPGEEPLTESDVIAHCRAHLEDYKVPRFVEFRSELPMTSSGKVRTLGLD